MDSRETEDEFRRCYSLISARSDNNGMVHIINEDRVQFSIIDKDLGCERMTSFQNEAAGDIREIALPTLESRAKL